MRDKTIGFLNQPIELEEGFKTVPANVKKLGPLIEVMILASTLAGVIFFYNGLGYLFNGISTFVVYLMPKPSLEKNSRGTI